jgi:peroxiredoxin (alkyl hydroperoxide reductase subunit C)
MKVAMSYGMIHEAAADTSAVRATFIIDPEGILRAMVYYPMSNGRQIDEFVRLLKAMQTSDSNACATPENWREGEKVIVPPPATIDEARARLESNEYECTDFYFCKKSL